MKASFPVLNCWVLGLHRQITDESGGLETRSVAGKRPRRVIVKESIKRDKIVYTQESESAYELQLSWSERFGIANAYNIHSEKKLVNSSNQLCIC